MKKIKIYSKVGEVDSFDIDVPIISFFGSLDVDLFHFFLFRSKLKKYYDINSLIIKRKFKDLLFKKLVNLLGSK